MTETNEQVSTARVRIGHWINRGWDWFVEDLGMHILITLIPALLIYSGFIVFLVGPVAAGVALAGLRKANLNRVEFKDFADGFSRYFLPAFLSGLLILVFSTIGLVFLIVPGLVIMAMYQFTFHFIVDRHEDFWQAMESSRKLVSHDYFGFTGFILLLALIDFLGVCFMMVGLLVTLPVSWLAITAAYLDFSGRLPESEVPSEPVRID
ncbi:hypothetical protein MYX84_02765 [Acidobacteria bacterium AH-259-O06]|nr:hypothetical protein [Acidobacteria bacterium AH-259-O06]